MDTNPAPFRATLASAAVFAALGGACAAPAPSAAPPPASRYDRVVDGILAAWTRADLVCLGEGHGRQADSDLRIALVRHVDFAKTVRAIVVESANPIHQGLLDRFILDGVDMSREELAPVWRDASNAEVWECPIYEAFLRAVHDVNRKLPRPERVRVLGGDSKIDWPRIERAEQLAPLLNRGANIRRIVAEEILDKHVKALAIYGSGHCVKIGGGFPGELADRYGIARMWCVWPLESAEEVKLAKTVLGFGAEPAYAAVAGTAWASRSASVLETLPADLTIGEVVDALVHHGVHDGESADRVVKADLAALEAKMGPELERRARLTREAVQLVKQRR